MINKNNYLASLNTCKQIAKKEYNVIQGHFEQCDNIIDELSKKLQGVIEHGSQTLSEDRMVDDGLTNMLQDLKSD